MQRLKIILLIVFFAGISYGAGIFTADYFSPALRISNVINKDIGKPEGLDFGLFWRAWNMIEEKHIWRENLDRQAMIYGAIRGLVGSLGDPHSTFFNPEDTKRFYEDVSGSFDGVGIELGIRKGTLTVISPLKNTPAYHAGLRAGDQIIRIDDTVTYDLTLDEAVNLIRGPSGTTVTLTVFREMSDTTIEVPIIRSTIVVPVLDWELKDSNIIYLQIFQFTDKTGDDLNNAVPKMINSGGEKIILDLRNNPGGLLDVSVDVAGIFLERDSLVVSEHFAGGRENNDFRTQIDGALKHMPAIVLINQGTASAAEILAEALRVNREIVLLGEKTFGKGSVQELFEFDSSSLKLTVAEWLTPREESINNSGIEPDIVVELTEEDFETGRDPQLERALEIIKNM